MYRIGHSKDIHPLVANRPMILGGVVINFPLGLLGHSDADIVYHVVCESIIGALGLGDIGMWFSDKDPQFENISSSFFVKKIYDEMVKRNYHLSNIDISIYLEKPILTPYKEQMKTNISELLHTSIENVNIKATRGEGLGYIGRMEGISAEAVVLLESNPQLKKL